MGYLITSGVGFIGSYLSEKLMEEGYDIIVIDNFNDYYNSELKEQNFEIFKHTAKIYNCVYKLYRGDIRDKLLVNKIFKENKINGVVSLAANAEVRPSIDNPSY